MNKTDALPLLIPDWPAPPGVLAYSTTREGGVSEGKYASLNLGLHVGDNPEKVRQNRSLLPANERIIWLDQVHSAEVVRLEQNSSQQQKADASFTTQHNTGCAVMTADCLPLLICHKQAKAVAAIHGGWRGLAAGIINNTFQRLPDNPENYLVWLGPAIGPQAFEVGKEVLSCFSQQQKAFVKSSQQGKYLADIYALASMQLQQLGVREIYGDEHCTFSESDRFFSYRRDGQTGRMASVISLLS